MASTTGYAKMKDALTALHVRACKGPYLNFINFLYIRNQNG